MSKAKRVSIDVEPLARRIRTVRGLNVILDSDLAALYGVTTKRFNEQVRRNSSRFPSDFMLRLTGEETESLRSQFATSKTGRGGRRHLPRVFTEHGAIMAASILNSQTAIEVSVYVVRAFVAMRASVAGHKEISQRLDELEARIEKRLSSHDQAIAETLSAIRTLMNTPPSKARPIGFVISREK
jgi:leucyl aminopeptidase